MDYYNEILELTILADEAMGKGKDLEAANYWVQAEELFASGISSLDSEERAHIFHKASNVDLDFAKSIAKTMGCPLDTKEGFIKLLPLLDNPKHSFFANKALKMNVFKEGVESEFGKASGPLLFSRLIVPRINLYKDGPEFVLFSINYWRCMKESLGDVEVFDILSQKDRDGIYFVQKDRSAFSVRAGRVGELLCSLLPGDVLAQGEESLVEACRAHPEKVKEAAQACLFQVDEGGKSINPYVTKKFWEDHSRVWCWATRPDILFEEGIISSDDFQILFKGMMQPGSFSLEKRVNWLEDKISFIKKSWEMIEGFPTSPPKLWKGFDLSSIKEDIEKRGLRESSPQCAKLFDLLSHVEMQAEKRFLLHDFKENTATKKKPFKI